MKKYLLIILVFLFSKLSIGQSQEAQQLLLNVEKLMQFKKILQNMKDGYQVLHRGYATIKDLSQGNFSLHKTFLDALMEVSPAVWKYKRISDIITYQFRIVKDCKTAFNEFRVGGQFTTDEVEYLKNVYGNLLKESVKSLDELSIVITAGKLRMSDEERLQAIDHIYTNIVEQYGFLQEFNNSTAMLALQRKSEKAEINLSKRLSGQK
jgi:hypothetical protein